MKIHRLAPVSINTEEVSAKELRVELSWISESMKHTHGKVPWKVKCITSEQHLPYKNINPSS